MFQKSLLKSLVQSVAPPQSAQIFNFIRKDKYIAEDANDAEFISMLSNFLGWFHYVCSPLILRFNIPKHKGNKFMGNILHFNAKTTIRGRKEIQESKESILKLAQCLASINDETNLRYFLPT